VKAHSAVISLQGLKKSIYWCFLEDSKKRNARDSLLKEIVSKVIKRTTSISHRISLSWQLAKQYQCISSKSKGQGFHFKRFLYLRHPSTRCKSAPNRAMTWSKAT
jgi:hypothetical protein